MCESPSDLLLTGKVLAAPTQAVDLSATGTGERVQTQLANRLVPGWTLKE